MPSVDSFLPAPIFHLGVCDYKAQRFSKQNHKSKKKQDVHLGHMLGNLLSNPTWKLHQPDVIEIFLKLYLK